MRRETKVWLVESTILAAIPLAQRTDKQRQRLRLLAQRLASLRPDISSLEKLSDEEIAQEAKLAEQLRPLWDILKKDRDDERGPVKEGG